MSNSAARFSCGRTKRRKSAIDLFSRSDSFSTIDISRCSCGESDFEFLQHLHRAGDRGERVPDLVRDAGRQLADRRHAVFQPQLRLELLHVGEVLEDQRVAGGLPFERVQRRDARSRCCAVSPSTVKSLLAAHDRAVAELFARVSFHSSDVEETELA